jgi:hypothetical protein
MAVAVSPHLRGRTCSRRQGHTALGSPAESSCGRRAWRCTHHLQGRAAQGRQGREQMSPWREPWEARWHNASRSLHVDMYQYQNQRTHLKTPKCRDWWHKHRPGPGGMRCRGPPSQRQPPPFPCQTLRTAARCGSGTPATQGVVGEVTAGRDPCFRQRVRMQKQKGGRGQAAQQHIHPRQALVQRLAAPAAAQAAPDGSALTV